MIPARISSRDGKIVSGLKREEFRIFENGVEQRVEKLFVKADRYLRRLRCGERSEKQN